MTMYGCEVAEGGVHDKFIVLDVPNSTWVVVTTNLEDDRLGIMNCYKDLHVNWFPTSGYQQDSRHPMIEKHSGDIVELWMPITKK